MSEFRKLPEWVHRIKIRFYQQSYPVMDEIVMTSVNSEIENYGGYHMNLIDYHNKEGLIVSKEMSRSNKTKVLNQVFNNNNNYPLQVIDIYHKEDESESTIELSNKNLDETEKSAFIDWHGKYKIIHTILHDFGYQLKQWEINNLENVEDVDVDRYKLFLESLALKTIWKYSRDQIIDIIQQVRDNNDKLEQYFDLSMIEKKMFIKCVKHHVTQTQYNLNCNFTLQSLSLNGLEIIKNVLSQFNDAGFKVIVVSPPYYTLKMDADNLNIIKDKFIDIREKVNNYVGINYSRLKYETAEIVNNKDSTTFLL